MSNVRSSSRWSAILMLLSLAAMTPLLTGCLERSTTVGDRYSGTVIVATSPDNPSGPPQFDIPESMAARVALSEYSVEPEGDDAVKRVGTRAVFSDLTAGQFGQLGDIVAESFGESVMSMDLKTERSGDVVRFRGNADLTGLAPDRDFLQLTVTFGGPITATNGEQLADDTVRWTPEPRRPSNFSADATYPDPATAAVSSWSWFLALVCLIAVLAVARLAWSKRDRGPRPGRPRRPAPTDSNTRSRETSETGS
ncbi:LppM family (lipo)protein [Gordonia rhizosphera]|uniref:LppM domain-containing protein n=1 Tax=Gordonia rhizosphera NBRC 16068 TaxID=1108045 RepID=K6WV33_9ACTN|nr:hypothetical protein [Gordonia rhizosphera]GAB90409.1 hypothetical protein GORHZ_102_00360 [Gordonia rhizosphera NBRC 16068]